MKVYKINGNSYEVAIKSVDGTHAEVTVNGVTYKVETGNVPPVQTVSGTVERSENVPQKAAAPVAGKAGAVTAPLPGVIVEIKVSPGEVVKAGQVVAVLEAMKMENEIQAESDGTIISVHVGKGDSVLEGTAIVTIQ
jgi:biotin carboxyl carrier protein